MKNYREDGTTPYFTFWKDGIKQVSQLPSSGRIEEADNLGQDLKSDFRLRVVSLWSVFTGDE